MNKIETVWADSIYTFTDGCVRRDGEWIADTNDQISSESDFIAWLKSNVTQWELVRYLEGEE